MLCPCGCGETFSPIGSRGRPRAYFSPACSLRVNHRVGGWEGRRHTPETRALLSAKARVPKPYLRGERNGMAGRKGPLSPSWRGGTTPERQRLYAGAVWRQLRRDIRQRAACMCERCGSTDDLHMHHIKPWATHPDLRFDLDNLILLCQPCHAEAHRKEVRHQ